MTPAALAWSSGLSSVTTGGVAREDGSHGLHWVVADLLTNPPPGVTVTWQHGGVGQRQFTAAMQAVAPDPHNQWRTALSTWISSKNAGMY